MNGDDLQDFPARLEPRYWSNDQPIVLHRGALRIAKPDRAPVTAEGEVRFEWLPSPRVSFVAWLQEQGIPEAMDPFVPGEPDVRVLSQSAPLELRDWGLPETPADASVRTRGTLPSVAFGDSSDLQAIVFNLINFRNFTGTNATRTNGGWTRNRFDLCADGWLITIDAWPGVRDVIQELAQTGGFAFTHVAQLQRIDGVAFAIEDADSIRDILFHFLAFARGALTGIALPVGVAIGGEVDWVRWDVSIVDAWRGCLSWADPIHAEALEELFPLVAMKWSDPFWRDVLRRAIRYYIDANDPRPVDRALIMCQAALELLAWTVLVEDQKLLSATKARKTSAAGLIGQLLKWARIDTLIPTEFTALSNLGAIDGPGAFTKARNRLVHPTHARQPFARDVMIEAWRLGQWWVELLILRICDFQGTYGSRLIDERWAGTVSNVPWAAGRTPAP